MPTDPASSLWSESKPSRARQGDKRRHTHRLPPDTTVNFARPREFGKVTADPRTASLGGQPLMNLTLQLTW